MAENQSLAVKTLTENGEPGQRLPHELKRRYEQFFNAGFDSVRIYRSAKLRDLGYQALASGESIFVTPDAFNDYTESGRAVMAHELSHVLQQRDRRVTAKNNRELEIVFDEAMETEADHFSRLFSTGASIPTDARLQMTAPGIVSADQGPTEILQPVVCVNVRGTYCAFGKHSHSLDEEQQDDIERTFSSKTQVGAMGNVSPSDLLWAMLMNDEALARKVNALTSSEQKKVKTKLSHWVKAPPSQTFLGKGHNKQFSSLESLTSALIGRVQSRPSKAIENKLAKKVASSNQIKRVVRSFLTGPLDAQHSILQLHDARLDADEKELTEKGRYSFFYSPFLSFRDRRKLRTLNDGMAYMKKKSRPTIEMCAFLADYVMVARENWTDDEYDFILPQGDARSSHFNVNEASDWVKQARAACVRLGAGPSATTMQVMRVIRASMDQAGAGDEAIKETMLCTALGLFAFWNIKRSKLQTRAEIHTYHEVMLVAYGNGAAPVPSLTGAGREMAQFEYPSEQDIPA